MVPKAVAIAVLSSIAIGAGGCGGSADAEAEGRVDITRLRAEFKERFGAPGNEARWYHLVTGLKMVPQALVTEANTYARLEVETKLAPGSRFVEKGMCGGVYGLAREFMEEDAGLMVAVIASDGTERGGCA